MVAVVPPGWEDFFQVVDVSSRRDSLDARIRLALARLDLDDGDLDAAKTEFETARDLVKSRDRWLLDHDLLVVESRLLLLSGDSQSALKLLKEESARQTERRLPPKPGPCWRSPPVRSTTGEVLDRARNRATELGVDLGPLGRN